MLKLATMTSVCPDWTLDEIIDAMQRHGYNGLEPRVGWGHRAGLELDMPEADRAAARRRLEEAGLACCCIATGAQFARPNPAGLGAFIDETRLAIDLAADLGAPFVRTFGGEPPPGELILAVEHTAANYRQILDHAAQQGVTLLLETHDFWCASAPVRAIIEAVNHPNLRVLWDLMHPQRACEDPAETMRNIGTYTRHLHAHDGDFDDSGALNTNIPLGQGRFDHEVPLKLLIESGYDGWISVEVIHKPGSAHHADAVLAQYAEGFQQIFARL